MKRIIKLIIILAMIPVAIYFWPVALGGNTTFLMVQGTSMLPTILPGSLVIIQESPEYQIDDIVAYEQKEGRYKKIIVHRIIDETEQGFVIQGDNNPRKDSGFPTEDVIIGEVLFSTPYVGDLLVMFRNPVVLVVAAIGVTGVQMVQKKKKEKKEKKKAIMLGIPYEPLKNKKKNKPKKADFSMFYGAIFFNVLTFILTQIAIENDIRLEGDILTGFLYRGIVPGLASTLILAFYFGIIFGLYFLAKKYDKKLKKTRLFYSQNTNNRQKLLLERKSSLMLSLVSAGWLLFILMSMFNLITMAGDIAPLVT